LSRTNFVLAKAISAPKVPAQSLVRGLLFYAKIEAVNLSANLKKWKKET
jgi:hypothetical protein